MTERDLFRGAGSIHAKSSDPLAAPAIRPNYLADPIDQRVLVDGMKIGRSIINSRVLDRYRAYEMNPGEKVQTDAEWLQFARENGQTTYHEDDNFTDPWKRP